MGSFLLLHSTGAFYFYIVLGQILVTCRGSGAAEGSGFGAERSSGPQTKNRPKIACCAQLSATPKRSQKNSGSVGKTPHVKMTSPWFNPSLGFAFFQKSVFWVEFLRDVFTQDGTFGQWDGETDTPCLSARDPQKPPFFSLQMGIRIDKSMPRVREFEIFRMSIRT